RLLLLLGPETIADARFEPSGTTSSLVGGILCDPHGLETCQTGPRIKSRGTQLTGIDDHADAVDRQTGFCDGCRQDDLSHAGPDRCDGSVLRFLGQVTVKRSDDHVPSHRVL